MKAYVVIEYDLEEGGSRRELEELIVPELKRLMEQDEIPHWNQVWVRDDFDLLTMGG